MSRLPNNSLSYVYLMKSCGDCSIFCFTSRRVFLASRTDISVCVCAGVYELKRNKLSVLFPLCAQKYKLCCYKQ